MASVPGSDGRVLQLKWFDTVAEANKYIGKKGEVVIVNDIGTTGDTYKQPTFRVHDGKTTGGFPIVTSRFNTVPIDGPAQLTFGLYTESGGCGLASNHRTMPGELDWGVYTNIVYGEAVPDDPYLAMDCGTRSDSDNYYHMAIGLHPKTGIFRISWYDPTGHTYHKHEISLATMPKVMALASDAPNLTTMTEEEARAIPELYKLFQKDEED